MNFKVKVIEATSPYDLEASINKALVDPNFKEYSVRDIKYVMTPLPGAKVSRGGIFYLASILFCKE